MKGFSLLEIMVTVAIISIMAASVVIGFNGFGATVRLQETAGVISDTVKKLELETVRRDYLTNFVRFEPDYLVVESEVEKQTLPLSWKGIGTGVCEAGESELEIDNSLSSSGVNLAQRDEYGNNMNLSYIPANSTETFCAGFPDSEETEWQYQVFGDGKVSQVIRLIHFNVRRDSLTEPVKITDNNYNLEITAPYAKKTYKNGAAPVDEIILELTSGDLDPETVTLK